MNPFSFNWPLLSAFVNVSRHSSIVSSAHSRRKKGWNTFISMNFETSCGVRWKNVSLENDYALSLFSNNLIWISVCFLTVRRNRLSVEFILLEDTVEFLTVNFGISIMHLSFSLSASLWKVKTFIEFVNFSRVCSKGKDTWLISSF